MMSPKHLASHTLLLLPALLLLGSSPAPAAGEREAGDFAVRAGTLIPIASPDLSPGVLIVRDGKIADIGGPELEIPEGMMVVDASDRVVMPGFVEAHGSRGLDRSYESIADASFIQIVDGLNPVSMEIEDARRNGLTTMLVAPSNAAFLAGRAGVIHPQGIEVTSMIVREDAALKISLRPTNGTSRMGHLAKLRKILDGTRTFLADREKALAKMTRKQRAEAKDIPAEKQALVDLLQGKIPAMIYCPTAADVSACFALAREYGFHVTPVLTPETWRAMELIRTNNTRVVVTPRMEVWQRQPDGSTLHVNLPKMLADAGVRFALTTDARQLGAQHPWYQAALAVRAGVPRQVALESITKVPAAIVGFGGHKGVLTAGADADFLILSDDPFSANTWVDESYVRGTRIYDRSQDDKLERLQRRGSEPPIAGPGDHPHVHDDEPTIPPVLSDVEEERKDRWPLSPEEEKKPEPAHIFPHEEGA